MFFQKNILLFLSVVSFLLSFCTSKPKFLDEFEILTNISEIINIVNTMDNPYGFLPTEIGYNFNKTNILFKNWGEIVDIKKGNRYYEFFVFDKLSFIIILSMNPWVAIKVNSEKFYNHLMQEYESVLISNKRNNTLYYYEKVGRYEIGILFAPNEIKRWNVDRRITLLKDLIGAAGNIIFFSVDMRDETLYNDIVGNDKKYSIFYPDNIFSSLAGKPIPDRFGFSFLLGQNIVLTEQLLKNFRGYSLDSSDLKKDFFISFSSPIGTDNGRVYDGNYFVAEDGNYSIVLVIKGGMDDKIIPFLVSRGVVIKNFDLKFYVNNNEIIISWDKNRDVDIYYSINGIDYNFISTYYGMTFILDLPPGYFYWIKVVDKNSLEENTISFIYPKNSEPGDIKITEILWMGSTDGINNFTSDEFIELKNVSNKYIDISDFNLYIKDNFQIRSSVFKTLTGDYKILAPGEYFLIINDKSHLFSTSGFNLDKIGIKHISSTSLSIPNTFPYYIEIRDDNNLVLDSVYMNGSYGYNSPNLKKSMVLKTSGWATSLYNYADNVFSFYTYCTPGFKYENEF